MKNIIRTLIFCFSLTALTSCGIIVAINDIGYRLLKSDERNRVKLCTTSIASLPVDSCLYQVNVAQVKEYIATHEDVVVYQYLTYCRSEACENSAIVERECEAAGLDFVALLGTYDYFDRAHLEKHPRLVMNHKEYNTNNSKKVWKAFISELTGMDAKKLDGNKYYFHRGKFVQDVSHINEIHKVTDE